MQPGWLTAKACRRPRFWSRLCCSFLQGLDQSLRLLKAHLSEALQFSKG